LTIDAPFADATIHDLTTRRRARHAIALTVAMAPRTGPQPRLDAGGARLRVRALHVMGHGSARIARALSVREETIQKIVRGDTHTISPHLRDAITALYDAWWDKRAPERTRAERAAATRARQRASSGNWCAGAALDDHKLDTPGYRPRTPYRPARGTGIAPDIRLPVRHHRKRGA
jgi:hypothetical protein